MQAEWSCAPRSFRPRPTASTEQALPRLAETPAVMARRNVADSSYTAYNANSAGLSIRWPLALPLAKPGASCASRGPREAPWLLFTDSFRHYKVQCLHPSGPVKVAGMQLTAGDKGPAPAGRRRRRLRLLRHTPPFLCAVCRCQSQPHGLQVDPRRGSLAAELECGMAPGGPSSRMCPTNSNFCER